MVFICKETLIKIQVFNSYCYAMDSVMVTRAYIYGVCSAKCAICAHTGVAETLISLFEVRDKRRVDDVHDGQGVQGDIRISSRARHGAVPDAVDARPP